MDYSTYSFGNNYVRNITLARPVGPHGQLSCYMRILADIVEARHTTRRDSVRRVFHKDLKNYTNGYECGPYTMLRQRGYVTYSRKRGWEPTPAGKAFLSNNLPF